MCIRDRSEAADAERLQDLLGGEDFLSPAGAGFRRERNTDGVADAGQKKRREAGGRGDDAPVSYTHLDVYKRQVDMPFEVMSFIGHYLEGLPGRKNLIWLSSEFPASVPLFAIQDMVVGNVMSAPAGSPLQAQGFDGSAPTTMGESWDAKVMKQAIDALNAAQVSVYPVNVAGLRPELVGIDTIADTIATSTGGRAYYNTNDFSAAMKDAVKNGSTYYEISYSPGAIKEDSSMRKIAVKLDLSLIHI